MKKDKNYQTNSSLQTLQERQKIIAKIRDFFEKKNVLAVETPILANSTNPDPYINSFHIKEHDLYLQTSPEFHMKMLLASINTDIYQITKSFRVDSNSKIHNKEFTMLEWYRINFDYHKLMEEVYELVSIFLPLPKIKMTYQEAFIKYLGVDPFAVTLQDCLALGRNKGLNISQVETLSLDNWLDLLMCEFIEPNFTNGAYFIYDFPRNQASLAKINSQEKAERFELYLNGKEIANGFTELSCKKEQSERFNKNNEDRFQLGLPSIPIDNEFLMALTYMPECSGVALGIDRFVMEILEIDDIEKVISYR